jgi:hypothetical protein
MSLREFASIRQRKAGDGCLPRGSASDLFQLEEEARGLIADRDAALGVA